MAWSRIAMIGVPSSAGGRRTGQDKGPAALRAAGLLERLRAGGLDVEDFGDLPQVRFRPDPDHPKHQNLSLVVEVAQQVADLVCRALAEDRVPLVLGGDCSLSLGVISGLLNHHRRLGLLYFDADLDLNTPDTSPSGILDGMVLAHVLGRGVPELAGLGPRRPMLAESDVVLFGYDEESGSVDPYEVETLRASRMSTYPLPVVREDPVNCARAAVRDLQDGFDGFLIHFDIDVTDLPSADVPHPGGLGFGSACRALDTFVRACNCVALVVTEFNAELDPDGSHAARLVDGLALALGP